MSESLAGRMPEAAVLLASPVIVCVPFACWL